MRNIPFETRVYGRICAKPPGTVWTVGDFIDFGPRDTINKALQRLAAAGNIRRIDRGLYDRPRLNQLTGKSAPPDYRAAIDAIGRRDQTRMIVDGMTAANDLGLSDAVPGRIIVHSDARLKSLRIGNQTIAFRQTSASKLYWADHPAMRIVQALHWLKPKLDKPDDNQRIRRRIEALLSDVRYGSTLRKDLAQGLHSLPTWMQDFLRDLLGAKRAASKASIGKRKKAAVS